MRVLRDKKSRDDLLAEIAAMRLIVTLCTVSLVFEHVNDHEWAWAGMGALLAVGMAWLTVRGFRDRRQEIR